MQQTLCLNRISLDADRFSRSKLVQHGLGQLAIPREHARSGPADHAMLIHNRSLPLGDLDMISTRILAGAAAIMMAASPVLAQTAQPVVPTVPAAPVPSRPAAPAVAQPAAPAVPARPATPTVAPAATPAAAPATRPAAAPAAAAATTQAQRVNLNTAAQADLDKLPQIGDARAKAILAERAKGRFTNWDNFVQRMTGTSVNQTAKDAIKDRVSF